MLIPSGSHPTLARSTSSYANVCNGSKADVEACAFPASVHTMDNAELRRRLGVILDKEEKANTLEDWAEVERLTDELQAELLDQLCPEIVDHYLDDVDIRERDHRYAAQQRERVRLFVETGEHSDGTVVPLWTCALALALVVGLVLWLVF